MVVIEVILVIAVMQIILWQLKMFSAFSRPVKGTTGI